MLHIIKKSLPEIFQVGFFSIYGGVFMPSNYGKALIADLPIKLGNHP
jgi:hypothetical protein